MIYGIDPVRYGCGRVGTMGDDFRHGPLRVAEMLGPSQDIITDVSLCRRFFLVDAEIANAGERAVEEGIERVRQRRLVDHR